jgi:DNA replication and repair protein RecF
LKLQRLLLENFRNHKSTSLECSPGVNIFLGDNGEGKTNILEGIAFICISKSIFSANDATVAKIGGNGFDVTSEIISDGDVEYKVQVSFDTGQNQKSITVNKTKIAKVSSLIGQFPVVILSPEQGAITFGVPAERRKFVDFVVSQSNRKYLEDLIDYRRILKQRNRVLSEIRPDDKNSSTMLEPWNESLVCTGSAVIKKRIEFISDFKEIMKNSYAKLAGTAERPVIVYEPSFECACNDIEGIKEKFRKELKDKILFEQRIGHSLVGPHRDEIVFQINNLDLKSYASQGQHKTFLVALKMAEFFYLKERCNETPILLLDDVLSELDEHRAQQLLEVTAGIGQIFLTSTNDRTIDWLPVASANPRKFYVKQGKVERVKDAAHSN